MDQSSTQADPILNTFRETRRLCVQISQLLLSTEKLMMKYNWSNASNPNYAVNDLSWSVEKPKQWLPICAFRFFKNPKSPNKLAFISVLIDDHFDREYILDTSVVTAGVLEYDKEVKERWEYWYARYYGHLAAIKENNLTANGAPFLFKNEELAEPIKGKFVSGKIFAIPLDSIKDEKTLETQIIKPLLNMLA